MVFSIIMILGERKVTREVRSSLYKKRTNTNAPRKKADRLTQNVTAYLPLPTPNHGLLFP